MAIYFCYDLARSTANTTSRRAESSHIAARPSRGSVIHPTIVLISARHFSHPHTSIVCA
jgi:hypothetical protein